MLDVQQIEISPKLLVYYLKDDNNNYSSNVVILKEHLFLQNILESRDDKEFHLKQILDKINQLTNNTFTDIKLISQSKTTLNNNKYDCLLTYPYNAQLNINDKLIIDIKPDQLLILENNSNHHCLITNINNNNIFHIYHQNRHKIKLIRKKTF